MRPVPSTPHTDRALFARIEFVARASVAVFLFAWIAAFYPFDDLVDRHGTQLGGDYAMFYVAGQMVLEGDHHALYDQAQHHRRLHALFPPLHAEACLPFRYPPIVALVMAPLAALPYEISYGVFFLLSCGAWWASIRILTRNFKIMQGPWRRTVLWGIAGCPVALESLIGGQASMLALLIVTGVLSFLSQKNFIAAGGLLALALYKPNVLAFFTLGCLLRHPRILRGMLPVGVLLAIVTLQVFGWNCVSNYFDLVSQLTLETWDLETPSHKVHGLGPWLTLLWPGDERRILFGLGIAATIGIVWRWRRVASAESAHHPVDLQALGLLLTVNALCNPYVPIYDLTLLLAAVLLVAEGMVRRTDSRTEIGIGTGWASVILATLYFGPHLSQVLAQSVGVQPFSLVVLVLSLWQAMNFLNLERIRPGLMKIVAAKSPLPKKELRE